MPGGECCRITEREDERQGYERGQGVCMLGGFPPYHSSVEDSGLGRRMCEEECSTALRYFCLVMGICVIPI